MMSYLAGRKGGMAENRAQKKKTGLHVLVWKLLHVSR